ncbi:hypothetical protein AB1L42_03455 [Thalassoglobus sp. JC818]|uniref:hypothetical protein n=1 Tax=Thalassoglobus sp. JC818 TaxID=3232136 RepID=UPI00345B44E5
MGCRVLLLIALVVSLGCGQAEQGGEAPAAVSLPRVELGTQEWSTPLTAGELSAFTTIVEHLPDRSVPDFSSSSVDFRGAEEFNSDELVTFIRDEYRSALDMQALGETWCQNPELAKRFKQMGVDPELFAALATRISLAWAASSIRHEIPILATERKLGERLAHLKRRHDHPEADMTANEKQLLMEEIEQTVAMSEFLLLLKTVPAESINQVRALSPKLKTFLPDSNASAQFENVIESSPEVMRVGHTTE